MTEGGASPGRVCWVGMEGNSVVSGTFSLDRLVLRLAFIIGVPVLLCLLALMAGSALAGHDLPFEDDFEDGKLDNWTVETRGSGTVVVDKTQSVSSPYGLHIRSGNSDSAVAKPNITYNHSMSVIVEFDFRYTGGHHWINLWRTYETDLVLDQGGRLVGWRHIEQRNYFIMTLSADRWYHIYIEYDASTKLNTIWIDDVEKRSWGITGGNDAIRVGDFTTVANNGNMFWDNFQLRYYDAPFPPKLISPEDNTTIYDNPKLEWEFSDREPTDYQTAYRVQVANTSDFTDVFYDTGNVTGTETNITPPKLRLDTWYWRAKVMDSEDLWGIWSKPFNFTIDRPNLPPVWDELPVMRPVEDVPFIYDFSGNVTDPDDVLDNLTLEHSSPRVVNQQGFILTFLFPNGVTEATINLTVRDFRASASVDVLFNITPVNDMPSHTIPRNHEAVEDIPYTFNATPYVSDIDNRVDELSLNVTDPYVTADGLTLTATFPDGILSHEVWLNVTDGDLSVQALLSFTITPVNDAPVISDLGVFTAIEDDVSVLNLTPYLSDIDNAVEDLSVVVRSHNCTVSGQDLLFSYSLGGVEENLTVEVNDGNAVAQSQLLVRVEERNDAPVVHAVSPRGLKEDESRTVDLSPYVEDEDDDLEDLVLACDHPAVTGISGLNVTLLYTEWVEEHRVEFSVSDGFLSTGGSFLVQVQAVNDPPSIVGLGTLSAPYEVDLDEGKEVQLQILVEDEDNTRFRYSLESLWTGATVLADGTLRFVAEVDEIGQYTATVTVDDYNGGTASADIVITVHNVNDPPSALVVIKPLNHTIVEEGTNVSFSVDVDDPDLRHGQVLTVTWRSNISGVVEERTSDDDLEFVTDALPVGDHRITVRVSDGEFFREAWFDVTVIEKYVPPPPDDPDGASFLTEPTGIAAIAIVIILVVLAVIGVLLARGRGRREEEAPPPPLPAEPPVSVVVQEQAPPPAVAPTQMPAGTAAQAEAAGWAPEPEPTPPPEPEPAPELEPVAVPTEEELAAREHATQVREVMKSLTQLPRGLPTALWGMDMAILAKEIVDGPRKTAPDGSELVEIDGKWYTCDHTHVGSFLQEWKEKERAKPLVSDEDKAAKLEKLEERLLEGQISEETYERLRKKYEE